MSTEVEIKANEGEQTPSQDAEVQAGEQGATASDVTKQEVTVLEVTEQGATEAASTDSRDQGQPQRVLSDNEKVGLLEALLLASGDPLPIQRVEELLGCSKDDVLALAESLKQAYAAESRGLELVNVSSKLQLRTKAIYAEYVRNLIAIKPRKLSQAALETLAVIAYQQPVVKSEIDKIRGVDVAPTIKTLLERNLVKILGYQATVGQPALYGTTEEFLNIFGLSALSELPSLRDLKALVKEPGEALESSEEHEESDETAASESEDLSAEVAADAQVSDGEPSAHVDAVQ